MKTISYHKALKHKGQRPCTNCGENWVSVTAVPPLCAECRIKRKSEEEEINKITQQEVHIVSRQPDAIIDHNGQKVFVDKFGNEVKNPGYDLENDPRGWGYTKGKKGKFV